MSIEIQGLMRIVREKTAADLAMVEAVMTPQEEAAYETKSPIEHDMAVLRKNYPEALKRTPPTESPVWRNLVKVLMSPKESFKYPNLIKGIATVSAQQSKEEFITPNQLVVAFSKMKDALSQNPQTHYFAGLFQDLLPHFVRNDAKDMATMLGYMKNKENFKKVYTASAHNADGFPRDINGAAENIDWVEMPRFTPTETTPEVNARGYANAANVGIKQSIMARNLATLFQRAHAPAPEVNRNPQVEDKADYFGASPSKFASEFRQGRTASQAIILRSAVIEKYLSSLQ